MKDNLTAPDVFLGGHEDEKEHLTEMPSLPDSLNVTHQICFYDQNPQF